jgi:hypothetical protein
MSRPFFVIIHGPICIKWAEKQPKKSLFRRLEGERLIVSYLGLV